MQVDSGLCQPAGTPISARIGRRLRVTFVHVETDVLRPVHVGVERRTTILTDIQTTLNTLPVIFSTTSATHLRYVSLGHFYDLDTLDFRFVFENRREAVERPAVQVEVAVPSPVLRLSVLTDAA